MFTVSFKCTLSISDASCRLMSSLLCCLISTASPCRVLGPYYIQYMSFDGQSHDTSAKKRPFPYLQVCETSLLSGVWCCKVSNTSMFTISSYHRVSKMHSLTKDVSPLTRFCLALECECMCEEGAGLYSPRWDDNTIMPWIY